MTKPISAISFCAGAYLIMPLFLFCVSFLLWALVFPMALIIVFVSFKAFRNTKWQLHFTWIDFVLLAIAVAWTTLAGITPFLVQNSDWVKHYAILNLLVERPWPVSIDQTYLRYSLGYYLIPAFLTKPFGYMALEWAVGLWTIIGVWLAFELLSDKIRGLLPILRFAGVFVFFSGMDYIGTMITGHQIGPPWHYEWWASFAQLPSITSTLFWAPQHGIPAWIGMGLLLNFPASLRYFGIIFVAVMFWSPFAAIGLVPFVLWASWGRFLDLLSQENFLIIPVLVVVASYLISGSSNIPRFFVWDSPEFSTVRFILFTVLEWGVLGAVLLFANSEKTLIAVSCVSLFGLSLVQVGDANDLIMRASGPAIVTLMLQSVNALSAPRFVPVLLLICLGVPTALGEMRRAVSVDRFDLSSVRFGTNNAALDPFRYQYFVEKPYVVR